MIKSINSFGPDCHKAVHFGSRAIRGSNPAFLCYLFRQPLVSAPYKSRKTAGPFLSGSAVSVLKNLL